MSLTVQNVIDEIQAETVTDIDDASMLVYFKSGARRVPALIRDRSFLAEDELTLAAGLKTLDLTTLDPVFTRERSIWYEESTGGRVQIYRPPSPEYFHSLISSDYSGKPTYYRIYGKTITFDKNADAVITVGFDYFREVGGLTLATVFLADERLIEAYKCFAKEQYYRQYEEDREKANDYRADGFLIIQELDADYDVQEYGDQVEEEEVY